MADMKNKLRGLLEQHGVMTGAQWRARLGELEAEREAGLHEIHTVVDGEAVENEGGAFFRVRTVYEAETPHGAARLGAALDARAEHIATTANNAALADWNPAAALYIDTETTGLAGGTGTAAFLVGAGYFEDGVFVLEQCFMRDFDEEEAMLRHLAALFRRCGAVVSYNGVSFDAPLLRSRFIGNRLPFPLDATPHYDLLHAARRLWRPRIGDCRLSHVEEEILGVTRQGDIPSHLIPEIWLDYIRSRDARKLGRVFYHHRMDILSLAALTGLVSACLRAPDGAGFAHAEDRLSYMRLLFRQRRYDDAVAAGQALLAEAPPDPVRNSALRLLAEAHKRRQDWRAMAEAWEALLEREPRSLEARHELAKYYEHRARDLAEARRHCAEALQLIATAEALQRGGGLPGWGRPDFEHRLARLDRKAARARRR